MKQPLLSVCHSRVGGQRTRELREVLGHETIENKTFVDEHVV
jgi:hypothetical protein